MVGNRVVFCVLGLALGLTFWTPPAEAGRKCVTYTDERGYPIRSSARASFARQHTSEFSAQRRPQITVYPRTRAYPASNARRYCRSQLVREYRASGTVIVPRTQCWWQ